MLTLVAGTNDRQRAQAALERKLKSVLRRQGAHNIGFPGGNLDEVLYSNGAGQLWAAFGRPEHTSGIPRFWNAFGIYDPDRGRQLITAEINIATKSNTAQVSGFFAKDNATGDIFLMHSGKIGGGRPGIGKSAYLVWSKAKLLDVAHKGKVARRGIAVGRVDDADLAERIWKFVKTVQQFKDAAAAGTLETNDFKRQLRAFDRYSREFSGTKRRPRTSDYEYVTYHGDVVEALYQERNAHVGPNEQVFNSALIDLFVKARGRITEIYEVKTGTGRQELYTAIGQLLTHASEGGTVLKTLVIPADENLPTDLAHAIDALAIQVRHFKMTGNARRRRVALL